jgi:lysyl-tRNA synthetase class 2
MPESSTAAADDWRPTASLAAMQQRAVLLRETRAFFDAAGYFEVETPLLSSDVCIDAWLDPFIVPPSSAPAGPARFLQTSPEFCMKRLLAAGAKSIYQVTRSFRQGERGTRHNPEFTIVEWYDVGSTLEDQMDLVERLVKRLCAAAEHNAAAINSRRPPAPFRRISYDAAFREFAGQSILDLPTAELPALAREHGVAAPASLRPDDRDGWLNLLLSAVVEPALARLGGVFLYDYPASQAALARVRVTSPPVAERFELYLDGIEICNGYHELTDPIELRRRMQHQAELRRAAGLSELPVESRLLRAMQAGLPECCGVALGFDRLALWRLGLSELQDVLAFPFDRA